jgi:hypothetical protein
MPPTTAHEISFSDEPIPYTLTPKASAFLDLTAPGRHEGTAIIDGATGWACGRCGFAWFGPVPDDGLCESCRPVDEPVCDHCYRVDCECWKLDDTRAATTREIPAYEWEW